MFLNKPVLQTASLARAKSLCGQAFSLPVPGSRLPLFWVAVIKEDPDLIAPS